MADLSNNELRIAKALLSASSTSIRLLGFLELIAGQHLGDEKLQAALEALRQQVNQQIEDVGRILND